ncbi:hypothetical protein D3C78_1121020 [compost metagenome]
MVSFLLNVKSRSIRKIVLIGGINENPSIAILFLKFSMSFVNSSYLGVLPVSITFLFVSVTWVVCTLFSFEHPIKEKEITKQLIRSNILFIALLLPDIQYHFFLIYLIE